MKTEQEIRQEVLLLERMKKSYDNFSDPGEVIRAPDMLSRFTRNSDLACWIVLLVSARTSLFVCAIQGAIRIKEYLAFSATSGDLFLLFTAICSFWCATKIRVKL